MSFYSIHEYIRKGKCYITRYLHLQVVEQRESIVHLNEICFYLAYAPFLLIFYIKTQELE